MLYLNRVNNNQIQSVMETGILVSVLDRLLEKIRQTSFVASIDDIIKRTQTIINQQHNPDKQSYISAFEKAVIGVLNNLDFFSFQEKTAEEDKALRLVNFESLFGSEANELFKRTLKDIYDNPSAVNNTITVYKKELNNIIGLHNSFNFYRDNIPKGIHNPQDDNLIVINFREHASIENLDELAKHASIWNKVLLGFSILTKENDRSFKIESVEKGSLILTLSAVPAIVLCFGKAAEKVLDVVKKYYEVKIKAAELKALKMPALDQLITDLDNQSNIDVTKEADNISNELIQETSGDDEEVQGDVTNAVNNAIKEMIKFTNKGGKLEIKLIASNDEQKQVEMNLNIKYREIKQIKTKISEIEGSENITLIATSDNDNDR